MNSFLWLGISYAVIWIGLGLYLAFLGNTQKNIIHKLQFLEGKTHE